MQIEKETKKTKIVTQKPISNRLSFSKQFSKLDACQCTERREKRTEIDKQNSDSMSCAFHQKFMTYFVGIAAFKAEERLTRRLFFLLSISSQVFFSSPIRSTVTNQSVMQSNHDATFCAAEMRAKCKNELNEMYTRKKKITTKERKRDRKEEEE